MPAKSEFQSQPELGVLGLREGRKSDFIACQRGGAAGRPATRARGVGANGALRSARGGACENTNPNIGTGANGRRSPRLGSCSVSTNGTNTNRSMYAHAGARSGALADITNVTAGRPSQADKVNDGVTRQTGDDDIHQWKTNRQNAIERARKWGPAKQPSSSSSMQPSAAAPEAVAAVPPASVAEAVAEGRGADEAQGTEGEEVQAICCKLAQCSLKTEGEDLQVNVQEVKEYKPDILNQLFRDEMTRLPRADYMAGQQDITGKMRTILIDWLVEVHMKYRLRPETLHLTVNLIDRYLTRMPVMRKRLQLVGVVAMFIASKFEEISPPELHDVVYITDNAYTKEDVLVMECTMLTTLSFHIMVPTAAHFFDIFQKVNGCDAVHREVVQYLLELGLLDTCMLQYTPSHTVAAAMLLSNELLKRSTAWPATMVQQSRNTEQALRGCADELRRLLEADRAGVGGQLQAVHKKFSVALRHGVSTMKF